MAGDGSTIATRSARGDRCLTYPSSSWLELTFIKQDVHRFLDKIPWRKGCSTELTDVISMSLTHSSTSECSYPKSIRHIALMINFSIEFQSRPDIREIKGVVPNVGDYKDTTESLQEIGRARGVVIT